MFAATAAHRLSSYNSLTSFMRSNTLTRLSRYNSRTPFRSPPPAALRLEGGLVRLAVAQVPNRNSAR
jgi:hypothetical protein